MGSATTRTFPPHAPNNIHLWDPYLHALALLLNKPRIYLLYLHKGIEKPGISIIAPRHRDIN